MIVSPISEEILRILKKENKPISTKDINKIFKIEVDLSNIYRNLNKLELNQIISSISFKGTKYYYYSENRNGHFILCKSCGEIQTFHICHENSLQKKLEESFDYQFTNHNLYFEGYCKKCR